MQFTPLENLIVLAIFIGISMLISGIFEIISFCGEEKVCRSGWMPASGILPTLLGIMNRWYICVINTRIKANTVKPAAFDR